MAHPQAQFGGVIGKKPNGVCYATASGTQRILRGSLRVSSQNKIQVIGIHNQCKPQLRTVAYRAETSSLTRPS
ncbi:hypothetical protein CTI12_AA191140 [Artemisia annua]|uniref:Uncharacterized protein n=1 Tax=Artemisia annua TaxID=35608 RepID=A0A2U1P5N6_ARTAN|nr:hypothetical protein CTI12_AA191140 [Artemisia annua]